MRHPNNYVKGWALALGLCMAATGCMPPVPLDDNGDLSFVRQVVPKVLGRKVKNSDEAEVLAQLTALLGREAVVWVLMKQPGFNEHWTDVLVDHLQVQRDGERMQSKGCFDAPVRPVVSRNPALFVRRPGARSTWST
jgi:hypothetical protein